MSKKLKIRYKTTTKKSYEEREESFIRKKVPVKKVIKIKTPEKIEENKSLYSGTVIEEVLKDLEKINKENSKFVRDFTINILNGQYEDILNEQKVKIGVLPKELILDASDINNLKTTVNEEIALLPEDYNKPDNEITNKILDTKYKIMKQKKLFKEKEEKKQEANKKFYGKIIEMVDELNKKLNLNINFDNFNFKMFDAYALYDEKIPVKKNGLIDIEKIQQMYDDDLKEMNARNRHINREAENLAKRIKRKKLQSIKKNREKAIKEYDESVADLTKKLKNNEIDIKSYKEILENKKNEYNNSMIMFEYLENNINNVVREEMNNNQEAQYLSRNDKKAFASALKNALDSNDFTEYAKIRTGYYKNQKLREELKKELSTLTKGELEASMVKYVKMIYPEASEQELGKTLLIFQSDVDKYWRDNTLLVNMIYPTVSEKAIQINAEKAKNRVEQVKKAEIKAEKEKQKLRQIENERKEILRKKIEDYKKQYLSKMKIKSTPIKINLKTFPSQIKATNISILEYAKVNKKIAILPQNETLVFENPFAENYSTEPSYKPETKITTKSGKEIILPAEFIPGEMLTKAKKVTSNLVAALIPNSHIKNGVVDPYYGAYILATFIQILVSNTPIDEEYYYYERRASIKMKDFEDAEKSDNPEKNKEKATKVYYVRKKHKPDDDFIRNDWLFFYKDKVFKSENFDESLFVTKSDKESILKIADIIYQQTKDSKNTDITFNYKNISEKYKILEYGGYKHDSPTGTTENGKKLAPYIGSKYGFKHGVKNLHSYQAPLGFTRLAEGLWNMLVLSGRFKGYVSDYLNSRLNKLDVSDTTSNIVERIRNLEIEAPKNVTGK